MSIRRPVSWAPKPEVFEAIMPDTVSAFLARRGWVRKPSPVSLMRRYDHPGRLGSDGEPLYYYFPDTNTSDEYSDSVKGFIENFARFYGLDPYAILAELQGGPAAEPVRASAST